ncbi:hypothetical protein D2T29_13590 [Sinirhodobacter populi]|uniref:Uncharacterized protein n=1 Tax=Paenirhodobacter populi TaxID=2306993 RepID=A0A443KAQ0_9RHOB|nr:hypothetical protein [Sinirhodobacter populi]RWR29815.1 hypothetical protein D2T29_13590 [Sinirhodobacter populi]
MAVSAGLGDAAYELTLPEGTATLTINGAEYGFDTADVLGKAPLILGQPTVQGTIPETLPGTLEYLGAPFLYDPAGGQPRILLRTVRNGATLGEGGQYDLQELDLIAGFDLRQEVVNGYGARSTETTLRDPVTYATPGLAFTGTQVLNKIDGLQPGGAGSMLIAVNLTGYTRQSGNQTLLYSTAGGSMFRVALPSNASGSVGGIHVARVGGSLILNNSPVMPADCFPVATDNLLILLYADAGGVWNYSVYLNGVSVKSASGQSTTSSALLSTENPWVFGTSNNTYTLRSRVTDFRIWTDIPAAAVVTSAYETRSHFIDDNGAARHPDIADTVYGQPRIRMPLDSDEANALINMGTAGDFTSKQGAFA